MRKKLRFQLRLFLAFIQKFKLVFLAGFIIGIFIFVTFGFLLRKGEKNTQTIGVVGEYSIDNLPTSITNLISSGLTTLDPSGKPMPGIAENWEIEDSGKTWTFFLNRSLKWQDGTPITSNDINYTFSDATASRPDKYTIIFKLKNGLAPFGVTVSRPLFKKGLLGNREWKVSNLSLAGSYINSLTIENKESIKTFKFYPTEDRAKLAFELGEVRELENLVNPSPFDSWSIAKTSPVVNTQRYAAVFFNTKDDLTGDKEIRQALSYAIDKNEWKNIRAYGPIPPNSWSYNPSLKAYDLDIDHAKELINDAKIDPKVKENLKIKLTTVADLLGTANKIAKDWEKIGFKVTIQVTQFIPDDFQAFLVIYNSPQDPDQYLTWHSTQTETNITKYKSARIDKLLEEGRLETNDSKRKQIYFDFQKFLVEDAPAAFLYYPTYYKVEKK